MGRIIHSPRLTALTIALAATSPTAQAVSATCPAVNANTSGQVTWTSGNCAVAASIVVPGTTGLVASGTLGTLTNTGTISGFHYGMSNSGNITLLNNTMGGTISASGGNSAGLVNSGTIGTLTNSGTITSSFSNNGNAIYNNAGTINTLTNSGVINSVNSGIFNGGGTIGTLTNTNIIAGNRWGITNGANIIVLNNTGGAISGHTSGINNASSGTIGTLTNTGTISSNTFGISNTGTIGTLTNSGTISGAIAISNGATGTLSNFTNSGVIAGNIQNSSVRALNINGGTGSTFGTLTGFVSGSMGTITSTGTSSNVNFGNGNLLLNDSVNVGSNTLNNTAATLQVNNAIAVTGNYNQGAAATLQIGVANNAIANGSLTGDSGYGRLVVTGSAIIAAGSSVSLKPLTTYAFAVGQRFVVVDASSIGTNYNQASLNYSAGGFGGVLSGTNVTTEGRSDLVVTLAAAAPTPPTTPTTPTTPSNPSTPPHNAIHPADTTALTSDGAQCGVSAGWPAQLLGRQSRAAQFV